jgi:hypothetical protein
LFNAEASELSDYTDHIKQCIVEKRLERNLSPTEAMSACAEDWRVKKATEQQPAQAEKPKVRTYYLMSIDGCAACGAAKEKFKAEIATGEIKVIDPTKDTYGRKMALAFNLDTVPRLLAETEDGKVCLIGQNGEPEACKIVLRE